jgi:hypothetical protein
MCERESEMFDIISKLILHYILSLEPHLSFFLEPSLAAKDTCLQRTLLGGSHGVSLADRFHCRGLLFTGFTVHVLPIRYFPFMPDMYLDLETRGDYTPTL